MIDEVSEACVKGMSRKIPVFLVWAIRKESAVVDMGDTE